ncbi:MAG: hypothetical protein H2069_06485 [Legionella sp.]|nr:hypothetical protein [Legionella sp.]
MREPTKDCCPQQGACAQDGIFGPKGTSIYGAALPAGECDLDECPCVPDALEQLRNGNSFISVGDCVGEWMACPFIALGNGIAGGAVAAVSLIGLACFPLIMTCTHIPPRDQEDQQIEKEYCEGMRFFGAHILRSSISLVAGAMTPTTLMFRTVRSIGSICSTDDQGIPSLNRSLYDSNLEVARSRTNQVALGPNELMPNDPVNSSKILAKTRLAEQNSYLGELREFLYHEKRKSLSEKAYVSTFKTIKKQEQKSLVWANHHWALLTLVKLQLFHYNLLPTIVADKVKYCEYSASTIREGVRALNCLNDINKIINVQNFFDEQTTCLKKIRKTLKSTLKESILDYYARPKNTKKDFKNILTLFLLIPGGLESHLCYVFLSCLNGYATNNPNIPVKFLVEAADTDKHLGKDKEIFYKPLNKNLKSLKNLDVGQSNQTALIDLPKKAFLAEVKKKFFPSASGFSFFKASINVEDNQSTHDISLKPSTESTFHQHPNLLRC